MYFILEGKAVVYDETDNFVIAFLERHHYFGEMAIVSGQPGSRTVN